MKTLQGVYEDSHLTQGHSTNNKQTNKQTKKQTNPECFLILQKKWEKPGMLISLQ